MTVARMIVFWQRGGKQTFHRARCDSTRALSRFSTYALMAMKAGAGSRDLVPPLLRNRVFRRYWGASTVSMFGDQVSSVAIPLTAVLVLHAKPYEMGYLTALEWLPSLLFGLHAGAWLDRRGKRRNAMILADLGRAAAFATIPLCYAFHVLTLAQMCVVTFVAGALSVLFTVSDGTLFVSIVEPQEYVDGQSLIYTSRALSFLGGPSVGGLLVQALSGPYAVVVDALSFLGSAFQLRSIRPVEPPAAGDERRAHRGAAVHRRVADRPGVADRGRGDQLLQPDVRGAVHALRGAQPRGQRRAARRGHRGGRHRRDPRLGAVQVAHVAARRGHGVRGGVLRVHRAARAGAARLARATACSCW